MVDAQSFGNKEFQVVQDISYDTLKVLALPEKEKASSFIVNIILDNAGAELLPDLIFVDFMLSLENTIVYLHFKPWPMFVSDATIRDFDYQMYALKEYPGGGFGKELASRLERHIANGRLHLCSDNDWGEPRDYCCLSPELITQFNRGH
jgi:hypothetical protein